MTDTPTQKSVPCNNEALSSSSLLSFRIINVAITFWGLYEAVENSLANDMQSLEEEVILSQWRGSGINSKFIELLLNQSGNWSH